MTHGPGSRPDPLAELISVSKRLYVASVRPLSRVFPRSPAPDGTVAAPERWRHWVTSLAAVHDLEAMIALSVPWWTYRSIEAVDAWMSARSRPVRVFEYGSGASTVWLAKRAKHVVTVEHDADFAELIRPILAELPNVTFDYRPAPRSAAPRVPSKRNGNAHLDFADYVAAVGDHAGPFDLVVIDGRSREACISAAADHLAPDGLIVFDNSRRRRYRRAIRASSFEEIRYAGLTPTLPYPDQTSLLFRPMAEGVSNLG